MASPATVEAMVLGITVKDVITAILIPIIAVWTTLIYQTWQQKQERRMHILRMLLATRHLPADAGYQASINLTMVEFRGCKPVMEAWRAYIDVVHTQPSEADQANHNSKIQTKQTKLIGAIMTKMKIRHSEADLARDAYMSGGFAFREVLHIKSLEAQVESAAAMKEMAATLRTQMELLTPVVGAIPKPKSES